MNNKNRRKPRIIGFYGFSGSGKTTLIEEIIEELKNRRFRVAVIKHSGQHIETDDSGKDTYRLGKAGAEPVVLSSADTTTIYLKEKLPSEILIKWFMDYKPLDFVLIESANEDEVEKIRIGEIPIRKNTVWTYDGDFEKLMSIVTKEA